MWLGHGYALYEPDQPQDHGGVQVGDVGFISRGRFHSLFNIMHKDSPLNDPLPENFEELNVGRKLRQDSEHYLPPDIYCSERLEAWTVGAGGSAGE